MTKTNAPMIVSIPDAMELLGGISRPTIYALLDRGELTRVHVGSRAFITTESIRELIERQIKASA